MFYAYYKTDTGELISTSSKSITDEKLLELTAQWIEEEKLTEGYSIQKIEYPEPPVNRWDPITRDFTISRPLPKVDAANLFLRMTLNEHAQIIALSQSASPQGYKIMAWMERMKYLNSFDKDNTELTAGMTILVQEGVFTQARALEILGWS